jgi:signal transduction histidine kinase
MPSEPEPPAAQDGVSLRLYREFLTSLSHELRALTSDILGQTYRLLASDLSAEQRDDLVKLQSSVRHLLDFSHDIDHLSNADSGQLIVNPGPVSVPGICRTCLQLVEPLAQKKELAVSLEIDPAIAVIQADESRLKQILLNLLSNAVKFTPTGGQIGRKVAGDALHHRAHFTVWDTGCGLSPQDLSRLFQSTKLIPNTAFGEGIGLWIALKLAELHGGRLSAESTGVAGEGSQFTVSLPWEPETQSP